MPKVIVSMVSFNAKEYLRDSLTDLLKQKTNSEIEIWVVDNNSYDGSVQMLKKDFPKVKLLEEEKNLGFAKAQNIILEKAKGDYYLLVNPDTKIPEDAIEKMVKFMEENPSCGIASSKIKNFSNSMESNGGDLPFGLALVSWVFNLEILGIKSSFHRSDKDFYESKKDLGWVGGTFMMIKKEVLEKVGLLSPEYFMYVEDVDYCYRAKKKGFKIMINPEVEIQHKSGGSSKNPRLFQWQNEFDNLIIFYKQHVGYAQSGLVRVIFFLGVLLRMIAFAITGKVGYAKAYAKIISNL